MGVEKATIARVKFKCTYLWTSSLRSAASSNYVWENHHPKFHVYVGGLFQNFALFTGDNTVSASAQKALSLGDVEFSDSHYKIKEVQS